MSNVTKVYIFVNLSFKYNLYKVLSEALLFGISFFFVYFTSLMIFCIYNCMLFSVSIFFSIFLISL